MKPPKKLLAKFSYPKKSQNQTFQTQKNPPTIPVTRNLDYPPGHHGGSLEIPRRRGVLKAKIFKGKHDPIRGASNQKNPPWGGEYVFSGTTQWLSVVIILLLKHTIKYTR